MHRAVDAARLGILASGKQAGNGSRVGRQQGVNAGWLIELRQGDAIDAQRAQIADRRVGKDPGEISLAAGEDGGIVAGGITQHDR